jgi:hypothetical protein
MKTNQRLTFAFVAMSTMLTGLTAIQEPVHLGTAADYAILAKTAISTTSGTHVLGDLGISPNALSDVEGFSQFLDSSGQFAISAMVTGQIYAADMGGATETRLTIAVGDMQTAYTDAASRPNPDFLNLLSGNLGSTTPPLAPGLYKWTSNVNVTGSVTIDGGGDRNAVWIFQIDGRFTLGASAQILLSGNANPANIFWQTAGGATLETNSYFTGNLLTMTDIAANTGASLVGRLLAQSAVTLQSNDVTVIADEPSYWVPGFGALTPLGNNRYRSTIYGTLSFADGAANQTRAWSESLGAWLETDGTTVTSTAYGTLTPNAWSIDNWVVSEFFGLVHFGKDAAQYSAWVHSDRFGWMSFVETYLWVGHLETWLVVNSDGSFYSFDFGWMIPEAGNLNRYNTRIGMVTADQDTPRSWLISDRFGYVWFARDSNGVWFWSERRDEWIAIGPDGSLWSTKENAYIL